MSEKTTALFGVFILAASSGCQAQEEATPAARFANATNQLKLRMGPLEQPNTPPRKSVAEVGRLLQVVDETVIEFGTPSFPVDGLNSFEYVCSPLNEISVRYTMAGINTLKPFKNNMPLFTQKLAALMSANTKIYQKEVIPLLTANVKCMALHMSPMENFYDRLPPEQRTPIRIGGLRQMRNGAGNMFLGLSEIGADPAYAKENRSLAISTASKYAAVFVRAMPISQRKIVLTKLKNQSTSLNRDFHDNYAVLVKAFSSTDCQIFCKID
jgi:hypothetical protein